MIKKEQNDMDKVFNYIQEKLMSDQLNYEEKITAELTIRDELNVSRSTVRDSINNFNILGILKRSQGSGTYPTNKDSKEYMKEVLEIKEKFDLIIVYLALERNREKTLNILEERLKCIESSEDNCYKNISFYDKQIAELTENNIMISLYNYIYKFVEKILERKLKKQSKEDTFKDYRDQYSRVIELKEIVPIFV